MKTFKSRKRDSGSVLLEALFSSVLIIFSVYAATDAKITLSTLSSSTDSRSQLTQSVREYSYLMYQFGSDLNAARGQSFDVWKGSVQTYCNEMVTASNNSKIDPANPSGSPSSFVALWQYNFFKSVPFMGFKLDSCSVYTGSGMGEQVFVELAYTWNNFDGKTLPSAGTNAGATPVVAGVRKETTHLNIAKPL